MDTFRELYDEIIQGEGDLASTLRKAKVLMNTLPSPEFDEWIDSELNGYADVEKVPEYRRVLWVGSESLIVCEGVVALEGREAREEGIVLVGRGESGDFVLNEACQLIPASKFSEVLAQVKDRLLSSLLEMDSKYGVPEGTDTAEGPSEAGVGAEEVANASVIINLNQVVGDNNVTATGEQVNQQVSVVRKDDAASLMAYLREQGVGEEDMQEIGEAVAAEPEAVDGELGPKVWAWLGRVGAKVAAAGVEAAPTVLLNALKGFYGV